MRSIASISALIFSSLVHAFQPPGFSVWYWQSSIVVDNWLYITGGDNFTLINGEATGGGVDVTYSIDLSQSWKTPTVDAQSFPNPSTMIANKKPLLWYDSQDGNIHLWGGLPWDVTQWPGHYFLIPNTQGTVSWSSIATPVSGGQALDGPFGAASAYSDEAFYSFGGELEPNQTVYAVQGLVSNDFLTNTWTNATKLAGMKEQFWLKGEMQYVSNFGDDGVLVSVGGEDPSTQIFTTGTELTDMSSIKVYDIKTKHWYVQSANGTIPPGVIDFCAVGVKSQDNSSFEIFMFGGGTNDTFDDSHLSSSEYRDVYVLSLPAFTWFRANDPSSVRRRLHACQVIGNRQMLIIGGVFPGVQSGTQADPFPNGLGIFDMSALSWTSETYNASAKAYEQPAIIQQYYAQGTIEPVWSDPALATIFPFRNASTSTNSTTPSHISRTSHTGAIVGSVVGCVAALSIVTAVLVFFFLKRRHQRNNKNPTKPPLVSEPPYEADSQMSHTRYHEVEVPTPELHGRHMQEMGGHYYDSRGQVQLQHNVSELPS